MTAAAAQMAAAAAHVTAALDQMTAAAAAADLIPEQTALFDHLSSAASAVLLQTVFPKAFGYAEAACLAALHFLKLLLPQVDAGAARNQRSALMAEMWAAAVLSLLSLLCFAGHAVT